MTALDLRKCRAVFLDQDSLDLGDLDLSALESLFARFTCHPNTLPAERAQRLQEAEVVISNKVPLDGPLLAQCAKLKLILIAATGTNNVDLAAAKAQGIEVRNCQGYGTASVAQHCLSLMLALATRLPDYLNAVRAGAWSNSRQFCLLDYPIAELAGKTLGILGAGELGQAVAQLAQAFDMKVLYGQLPGRPARSTHLPLTEFLPQLDVLSLHCPLTEQTQHLVNRTFLAQLPAHAWLINTARGGLIDEPALAEALRHGRLAAAALDVLSSEPPPADHPLLASDIPNLLITPHCAWGSRQARQRIVLQLAENARHFAAGSPLRVVSPRADE